MYRFMGGRVGSRELFLRSEAAFSRALELDHQFHRARFDRGLLYWREMNAPSRAITDFNAVQDHYPEALFLRGMAYQALGDYHNAIRDLEMFLNVQPHSRWVGNVLSQLETLYAILDELPPHLPSG